MLSWVLHLFQIFDTGTNRSEALCGDQPTFTWTADSNEVKIRFSAESEEVFNRFHATYVTIPKAPQTGHFSFFSVTGWVLFVDHKNTLSTY